MKESEEKLTLIEKLTLWVTEKQTQLIMWQTRKQIERMEKEEKKV